MSRSVSGIKASVIRTLIQANVLLIALLYIKNPLKAFKMLASVKARRKSIHGSAKVRRYIRSGRRFYITDNIPGWPSAAFSNYIRGEIQRSLHDDRSPVPLSTILIAITSRCPMHCNHCYEHENLSSAEHLSTEDLMNILRKVKDYGAFHIQLTGGEPLERFDVLPELIRCSSADADVWINTSGWGLTRERALTMKKAGLTGAEISLDSWDEDDHNRFRGNKSSFSWVRQAVSNCRETGLVTSLSLCATGLFVTEENLDRYYLLAMKWGVNFIRLLEPRETPLFKSKEMFLSDDQKALLESFYLRSLREQKAGNPPVVTYPAYHQRRLGCMGAGNRYAYIDSRGDIHACPFCRRPAGNAVTAGLSDSLSELRRTGCHFFNTCIND